MRIDAFLNEIIITHGFIRINEHINGYEDYYSEKWNLKFTYGTSNGDRYYLLYNNGECVLNKDLSFMNRDKNAEDKIMRKFLNKIIIITRKIKIENALED